MEFKDFQAMNRKRCVETFHESWPIQNWALAIAGESGELCNLIKKCIRGDFTFEEKRQEILDELADVITYCDLAISELKASTEETIISKFDVVSARYGWKAKP